MLTKNGGGGLIYSTEELARGMIQPSRERDVHYFDHVSFQLMQHISLLEAPPTEYLDSKGVMPDAKPFRCNAYRKIGIGTNYC
jgi:hypothetical protein